MPETKKKVKVFRKKLWEEDLKRCDALDDFMQSLTWPDKMDGKVVPKEDEYLYLSTWLEEVEE